MEMIEMDDVILNKLDSVDQVADDPGVVRDLDSEGVFNCSHGAGGMNRRSDPSYPLGEQPSVPGIPPSEYDLHSPKHRARTPGLDDFAAVYLSLNSEMTFDARDWINSDLWHYFSSSFDFGS
jgi:hypothetical protein